MASNYKITIAMSESTVSGLLEQGYYLYAFKAVQTSQGGGAPLVWFKTQQLSLTTEIDWQEQYQAYVSSSSIVPNGKVVATNAVDIDLGQQWDVNKAGGGPVVKRGPVTAISINNTDSRPWTTGISQNIDGKPSPMCAFPLNGMTLDVIAPIQKVLLMFATDSVNTGTVIYQSFSQGVLVDLTSSNFRPVTFDLNQGWSWGGYNWAQSVRASTDLVPFLIEHPPFVPNQPAANEFRISAAVL